MNNRDASPSLSGLGTTTNDGGIEWDNLKPGYCISVTGIGGYTANTGIKLKTLKGARNALAVCLGALRRVGIPVTRTQIFAVGFSPMASTVRERTYRHV